MWNCFGNGGLPPGGVHDILCGVRVMVRSLHWVLKVAGVDLVYKVLPFAVLLVPICSDQTDLERVVTFEQGRWYPQLTCLLKVLHKSLLVVPFQRWSGECGS